MAFLAVAIFGLIIIIRALVLGAAAADGKGLRRDDQPFVFWAIVFIGITIDFYLFYLAYKEFSL